MAAPETRTLPLSKITADPWCQSRAETPERAVAEYAELMALGQDFPPLVVYFDGKKYWLSEGFTRHAAALKAGLKEFACVVRSGTRRDAARNALHSNAEHGFRRTNADKRHAVLKCLADDEWRGLPDRQIARLCAVTREYVWKLRQELKPQTEDAQKEALLTDNSETLSETSGEANALYDDSHSANGTPAPETPSDDSPDPTPDHGDAYEPPPENAVLDGLGRPVPDPLRDVFADPALPGLIGELEAWAGAARFAGWKSAAKRLADAFPYLRADDLFRHLDAIADDLDSAVRCFRDGLPYAPCPNCDGRRCDKCRFGGHVPQWRLGEVKEQVRLEGGAA